MRTGKLIGVGLALLLWQAASRAQGPQTEPRFPHGKEKHRTLACAKCHTLSPSRIEVDAWPGHAACLSCHNLALEAVAKPRVFCGVCHAPGPITKEKPSLLSFPRHDAPHRATSDFGAAFSHAAHLNVQPADPACKPGARPSDTGRAPLCTDCHRRVDLPRGQQRPPGVPEMTMETGHAVCFQCHCEAPSRRAVGASIREAASQAGVPSMYDCAACHRMGGTKPPHLFDAVPGFAHLDHEVDTRPRRKADARRARPPFGADALCRECHATAVTAAGWADLRLPEERACASCHTGRIGLPEILRPDVTEKLRRR